MRAGTLITIHTMEEQTRLGLSEFRRWRLTRNLLIWGFVPGVLLASNILSWIAHLRFSFFIVVGIWMLAIAYVGRRVRLWSCPQCGKAVMRKGWFHNDFSPKCLHCGFSLKA